MCATIDIEDMIDLHRVPLMDESALWEQEYLDRRADQVLGEFNGGIAMATSPYAQVHQVCHKHHAHKSFMM